MGSGLIKKVWSVFKAAEKQQIYFLFGLLFLTSIFELIGLVLVIPYVNMMMDEQLAIQYLNDYPVLGDFLSIDDNYQLVLSAWFAGFYIVKNVLLIIFMYIQQGILTVIEANIAYRMYRSFLTRPYADHLNMQSSELVRYITYDSLVFVDGILSKGALLITELLLLFGVLCTLITISPEALVVMSIMIIPIIIIYVFIRSRLRVWGEILQEREAKVICHLQEGLGGIKDVIVLGVKECFLNIFQRNVDRRAHIKRNRGVAIAAPRFVIESLMMITMAAALVWLGREGGLEAHFSTIAFLALVTVRLLPMSTRVLQSISSIRTASPSVDIVYENVREFMPSVINEMGINKNSNDEANCSFGTFDRFDAKNISFNYENSRPVIQNVSFSLKSGEMVGVVGGSGAGKTTLIDLLLGLLNPTTGEIFVNNADIADCLTEWQSNIGYVQQSVFLVDATIAENIAFGVPAEKINQEQIQNVVRLAKLDIWIDSLEDGVDTWVGERGVRISGGQRQRIGIARALYNNPQVLILDEATSALDNRTEHEIMNDIYSLHGEKTIVMIAHRLDTIKRCDRILVFDSGELVGDGTYESLLKNNSTFQNISMQARINK
jgi:ATP-binding cassette, subfamily B, bacterial PglK